MGETMTKETKEAFDNITDTFTGGDGGVRFLKVKFLIEEMDRQSESGNADACQIIRVIKQFSRLIDFANKK
jgi:hypothetical protein